MEQKNEATTTATTKENRPTFSSPVVHIERTFHAPVERVWQAWSNVELIKQWWGPKEYSAPEAKIDFRVGGKYLFAMKGPDQKVVWSGGVCKEIIPNKKIVWTDHFADKDGNIVSAASVGMPGDWPEDLRVTIQFESVSPQETKMVLDHEGIPKDMHDDCVAGWGESIDKLQKLLERN